MIIIIHVVCLCLFYVCLACFIVGLSCVSSYLFMFVLLASFVFCLACLLLLGFVVFLITILLTMYTSRKSSLTLKNQ